MKSDTRWTRWTLLTALLLGVSMPSITHAQTFDPAYRFRTMTTPHFVIYFHQGEDRLAARLSAIAEDAWHALQRAMTTPPARTHVVIVDQTELPNGYATPVPRDAVVMYAAWPAGSDYLVTDDWLRLVFTHEFTHIVHLDRSESWARVVHGVFGRVQLAFPNTLLPTWQIEGLATYEESAITGAGRMHAGDFRAIVDEAARAGRLEPLDRVNGGVTDWPAGLSPYAYGLSFHAYLADRFGPQTFGALADATARRVPYTTSRVFERLYGRSLSALWKDFEANLAASNPPAATRTAQRLTHHGFTVLAPRFASARCATCAPEIIYSVRTAHELPALYSLSDGETTPRRMTTRYLGSTIGLTTAAIYFDQQEVRRNTGIYSDLYVLDRTTGRVRALTHDARLLDPDVSPDGHLLAAVRATPGERDLVLVRLSGPSTEITTLAASADTQFNAPRWSPDGRSLVAERHRLGARSELVMIDIATHAMYTIAGGAHARWATPTWRPDGQAVVASAAFDDGPFNVYEIEWRAARMRPLTQTTGGATWPDVSANGMQLLYIGYTADGSDVFRAPYAAAGPWQDIAPIAADAAAAPAPMASVNARPYSPWATVAPTSWMPTAELANDVLRIGALVTGSDVLRYHTYSASIRWLATHPAGAPAFSAAHPDWSVSYTYTRRTPVWFTSMSSSTSFFAGPSDDSGLVSVVTRRERRLETGIVWPWSRVRVAHVAQISILKSSDQFIFTDRSPTLDRSAVRTAWATSTSHVFGYSISPERGITVGGTSEFVRRALGASADATSWSADVRAYVPGLGSHHVLALRASGGAGRGDRDLTRVFLLGGPGPNTSVVDFGSSASSLLRGFPSNTFAGSHVALVNADYRWPLATPQRGIRTWPLLIHTIHAAVFFDAGQVWTRSFTPSYLKTSAGAELALNIVAGYSFPLTATVGAAWGHDGSRLVADSATVYFRLGRAF